MIRPSIGIVRELYSKWERRSPFTPNQIKNMVEKQGIQVTVQPSRNRVFPDSEYKKAGAKIQNDLSDCGTIFGVKQVPVNNLIENKTYAFFSHTIKAQEENMELLDNIQTKQIRLLDYECIEKNGKRVVAFGEYAGIAGMIDSFRGLGQRLLQDGFSTPFLNVPSAYMCQSLDHALEIIDNIGHEIATKGLHPDIPPLTFTFTGTGNVSKGAQRVFRHLPHEFVPPSQLGAIMKSNHKVFGCVAKIEDTVCRKKDSGFNKNEYNEFPERYKSKFFATIGRQSNVIVNCSYWDERFPRIVSSKEVNEEYVDNHKVQMISDLSCDVDGSIELLKKSTDIDDPFFTDRKSNILMLGVDILPSELPRESSHHFGEVLLPYVKQLALDLPTCSLPKELRNACITTRGGRLGYRFRYIKELRERKLC